MALTYGAASSKETLEYQLHRRCIVLRDMGILHLPSPRGRLLFHEFDPNYVQRLREGDPETERHFIAYFAPLLLIKLRTKIRSAVLIEDIRQETFLRTIRAVRSSN